MRISDWSSDVCSSDLPPLPRHFQLRLGGRAAAVLADQHIDLSSLEQLALALDVKRPTGTHDFAALITGVNVQGTQGPELLGRSEEHTSELQSLMRISYAVFCLKKKKLNKTNTNI